LVTECRIFSHLFPSGTYRVTHLELRAACSSENNTETDEKRFNTSFECICVMNRDWERRKMHEESGFLEKMLTTLQRIEKTNFPRLITQNFYEMSKRNLSENEKEWF